jgi:hypothetical protein
MSLQRHRFALLSSATLAALLALCAWSAWRVSQPELDAFMLPGAHDVRQQRLAPGLLSITFNYEGSVGVQTSRLRAALEQRGWSISSSQRTCDPACVLGETILIYTRVSVFNLIREVATFEQRGVGPYQVRVVLRRCYQLPQIGCWPR